MTAEDDSLLRRLRDAADGCVRDKSAWPAHATDWTGRFAGAPRAVVAPADTGQTAAILQVCRDAGIAVVPQGGNTGLVGGGVPVDGGVVIDMRRLDTVHIDAFAGHVVAGAGATVSRIHRAAAADGLAYAVDLASRDSATLGGTIATNAGGMRVLRHGDTRAQLVAAEAVLADGTVLSHLDAPARDNTGYHLPSLLCGSEGTLAVVTRARMRLVPLLPDVAVALIAFDAVDAALSAASTLRGRQAVQAVELVLADGVDLVCAVTRHRQPFPARHPALLVVEAAAETDAAAALAEAVSALKGVQDVAVATDRLARQRLWDYRERHTESISTLGPTHKLDVTLPPAALPAFVAAVASAVTRAAPAAKVWLFGHAADGNAHVNITGADPDDFSVDDAVLRLVAASGGSISTEHGIGRAKLRWLHLARTPGELRTFRAIKDALDPDGTLNPGVLLRDPGPRSFANNTNGPLGEG